MLHSKSMLANYTRLENNFIKLKTFSEKISRTFSFHFVDINCKLGFAITYFSSLTPCHFQEKLKRGFFHSISIESIFLKIGARNCCHLLQQIFNANICSFHDFVGAMSFLPFLLSTFKETSFTSYIVLD